MGIRRVSYFFSEQKYEENECIKFDVDLRWNFM